MLTAEAQVKTEKAERYLKALCNHFSHKVTAEYDGNHGKVQFGIGECEMDAEPTHLIFRIRAEDGERLEQIKYVISDHLERFSGEEALQLDWIAPTG